MTEDAPWPKRKKVEFEGEVTDSFKSGMHRITLDNGHQTLGYTSGRMRRYRIRINPGVRVKVELSASPCNQCSPCCPLLELELPLKVRTENLTYGPSIDLALLH